MVGPRAWPRGADPRLRRPLGLARTLAERDRVRWPTPGTLAEVRERFAGTGVSWGPYQTFHQLIDEDPRCSPENPMFSEIEHPGAGGYLAPASPLGFAPMGRLPVKRAPILGEHTEEILGEVMGLSDREIGDLFDRGAAAGPKRAVA